MAIPNSKTEQTMFDLIEACRTGEAFNNITNKFYGKVEERFMKTSDFYHPSIDQDNSALYNSAPFVLEQVRVGEISENKYKPKYESIRSKGITTAGWAILDQDSNSTRRGIVLDGCTRIILARTCEENGHVDYTIPVPMNVITDSRLIRIIQKSRRSFQTLANDHLPADASSADDIKKFIRGLINDEPTAAHQHQRKRKQKIVDHVYRMVRSNKTRNTVQNWVSEIYNTIEQHNNGVKGFLEPKSRAVVVRKALESGKGAVKVDPSGWNLGKLEYLHEDWKIYQGSPERGSLDKDFGREVARKAAGETEPSVYVFRTSAKTPEKVQKAQAAVFDKINKNHSYLGMSIFDHVFALGQETGVNEGTLLTEGDVRSHAAKQQLKIVSS
jgi:hypothetical protein